MMKKIAFVGLASIGLSACDDTMSSGGTAQSPFIADVPESITSIAANGQDLTALKIDPIDGCYVYRHIGPVETTFLPLRAKNGRPICSRAASS